MQQHADIYLLQINICLLLHLFGFLLKFLRLFTMRLESHFYVTWISFMLQSVKLLLLRARYADIYRRSLSYSRWCTTHN